MILADMKQGELYKVCITLFRGKRRYYDLQWTGTYVAPLDKYLFQYNSGDSLYLYPEDILTIRPLRAKEREGYNNRPCFSGLRDVRKDAQQRMAAFETQE